MNIRKKLRNNGLIHGVYSFLFSTLKGYEQYRQIQQEFGGDCKIYLAQHPGTGDVYLQAKFLSAYAKKQNVSKYVFAVIGGAAYSVAELYGYDNIKKITLEASNNLVNFYRFMGEYLNMEVIHYHPMMMYYGGLGYVRNYHKNNFYKMLSTFVFPQTNLDLLKKPHYAEDETFVEKIFKYFYLKENKTVLLAPYANSLISFPNDFWETLVDKLNKKGYSVCTNSSGISEPAIKGTCAVYIPYKYLKIFLTKAGNVISYRSGFSDIISEISCKKIILYSEQEIYDVMGGLGTTFDYFSLKKMGLCTDAIEYKFNMYNNETIQKAVNIIINYF